MNAALARNAAGATNPNVLRFVEVSRLSAEASDDVVLAGVGYAFVGLAMCFWLDKDAYRAHRSLHE